MFNKTQTKYIMGRQHNFLKTTDAQFSKQNFNEKSNNLQNSPNPLSGHASIEIQNEDYFNNYENSTSNHRLNDLNLLYQTEKSKDMENSKKNIHLHKNFSKTEKFNRMLRKKMFRNLKDKQTEKDFNETAKITFPGLTDRKSFKDRTKRSTNCNPGSKTERSKNPFKEEDYMSVNKLNIYFDERLDTRSYSRSKIEKIMIDNENNKSAKQFKYKIDIKETQHNSNKKSNEQSDPYNTIDDDLNQIKTDRSSNQYNVAKIQGKQSKLLEKEIALEPNNNEN